MYRILLIGALLLTSQAFGQQKSTRYSVNGYLANLKGRTVFLVPPFRPEDPIGSLADSCVSTDGHFSFQGVLGEGNYYAIGIQGEPLNRFKPFLLDNSPITILGDADSLERLSIVGSLHLRHQLILDKSLETYVKKRKDLEEKIGETMQKGSKDTALAMLYAGQYRTIMQDIAAVSASFIELHPGSLVSLFQLSTILPTLPKEKARNLWNRLDYALQQHSVGRRIHDQVFDRKPEARQHLPNLILADKQNKPVSLLNYQGNVVLIDFWASWCDQCRREHAQLKSLYRQYKNKGLQIISISVDEDPKAWKKALQKAGLPWTQLSDRIGPRNVIGTQYGTSTVPINMLIDREGYIIRKGLHGAELEKQLAVAFE
ncbi:hypothetical protein GCM10027299_44480 [Larkinella ripae]